MAKQERKTIEVVVGCDTSRLYGSMDEAISYLQEIKAKYPHVNIALEEHWWDHEAMEMRFTYTRLESEQEFSERTQHEALMRQRAQDQHKEERKRQVKLKEYNKLKRELGI